MVSKNTGVFIGLDKQPRVFLGSIKADRDFLEGAGATDEEAETFLGLGLDLKDVLDPSSDFLLREYPDLNNVKVIPDISGKYLEPRDAGIEFKGVDVTSSFFDTDNNVLRVAADPRGTPENFEKQLAVPIQNYIQKKEGFAEVEQVDEIYEALRKEPVFEGSPPTLLESMEASDAAFLAKKDLRESYKDLLEKKEKEFFSKYTRRNELSPYGHMFVFSQIGQTEPLLRIADFGKASPARKNQNIEIGDDVGFYATQNLDKMTDLSFNDVNKLRNKINELFEATPNEIETQVKAGKYPKFLANKFKGAIKLITDTLDEEGERKESRLLSGLRLKGRYEAYGRHRATIARNTKD